MSSKCPFWDSARLCSWLQPLPQAEGSACFLANWSFSVCGRHWSNASPDPRGCEEHLQPLLCTETQGRTKKQNLGTLGGSESLQDDGGRASGVFSKRENIPRENLEESDLRPKGSGSQIMGKENSAQEWVTIGVEIDGKGQKIIGQW